MKALVIAPQPFFSPRGTPFSVYYRTMVMAQHGVEVDLLTYGEGQDVVIPGCRIIRIPRIPFMGKVKVGPSLTKLFLDGFIVWWTMGLLLKNRYAFVHAHEEAVFFCRFLEPLFGFKLVYDMHSSLPQQLTNFRFSESKILIGIFERLERTSLRTAEAVITISPALAEYALAKGVDPERVFLIENSIFEDVRLAAGSGGQEEAAQHVIIAEPSSELIVYAGTLEPYQGVDILLRAFRGVRDARPDARLLVVGGTPDQVESLHALAAELSLGEACLFTGRVSQPTAREYLERASVVVSPRSSGTNTPLKIYEQLASGKPLVATRISAHTQVLTDEVCFLVEPEPDAMARGLIEALADEQERSRRVAAALELYEKKYSRGKYEQKIHRLLEVLQ